MQKKSDQPVSLKRSISLPALTFYGLGAIVGGGFYALVGKVSNEAGMYAPVSMLVAAGLAMLTVLSYAELSARFPSSAGTSRYVHEAFKKNWLSILVGWLVIMTGLVSAATLANAFIVFLSDLIDIPRLPGITIIVALLCMIAVWGITESVAIAIVITVFEVGGLLYVLYAAGGVALEAPYRVLETVPPLTLESWLGVGFGAFLIFYAFIGFEDMVTLAQEVKNPRRTLPLGIILALGLTTILYVSVSIVAVLALPQNLLTESNTPLAQLIQHKGAAAVITLTVVSMFAGINGALVQLIMAARTLYGMASKGLSPLWLACINSRTRTPVNATLLGAGICLVLALGFPLLTLAKLTSAIILIVFMIVNISLIVVKHKAPEPGVNIKIFPVWIPYFGAITIGGLLILQLAILFD
ncbi:MAG: amino acid permease [Nitrosomonas sp.]|nr:amino acid permease [Nitrosomonas sp.]